VPISSGPAQELILEVGCCSVLLQCVVAVRRSVLQHVADDARIVRPGTSADFGGGLLQCVAVCCSVLQCVVAVRCSVLQRVAGEELIGSGPAQVWTLQVGCCRVCCSGLLQCVAVRCSVLQRVADEELIHFSCVS